MLPFSRTEFIEIFVAFNHALWPAQLAALALGLSIVVALLATEPTRANSRMIGAGLAAMWLATGVGYHGAFFTAINPLAWGFAALFVGQGLLLLRAAWQARLVFEPARGRGAWLGWALLAYALVVYPALGLALGQRWDELPAFGLTPCPLTLFASGLFLLATPPLPQHLLVTPLLWSLVGSGAALLLSMPQDGALLVSAAALGVLMFGERATHARQR